MLEFIKFTDEEKNYNQVESLRVGIGNNSVGFFNEGNASFCISNKME